MATMTSKPIIGITMGYKQDASASTLWIGEAYIDAVINAGGLPYLLPSGAPEENLAEMLSLCDGLILTGGADIDPLRFQATGDDRAGGVDPKRDAGEDFLVHQAYQNRMPILGICRGIQVLNVSFGGTLYIDLQDDFPGASKHDFYPNLPRDAYRHTLSIDQDNPLYASLGKNSIQVNSLHHQGVKDPAPNMEVVARPEDGSIEAIAATDHPWCIGVQWHPECLPEDADARKLFQEFIKAADIYQQSK